MQRERTAPGVARADGGGLVCMSRDVDGHPRRVFVPACELRNPHLATSVGGTCRVLARPMLAGYTFCTLIPAGTEFGHACQHDRWPHSIKVLVDEATTEPDPYRRLLAAAAHFRPSRRRR